MVSNPPFRCCTPVKYHHHKQHSHHYHHHHLDNSNNNHTHHNPSHHYRHDMYTNSTIADRTLLESPKLKKLRYTCSDDTSIHQKNSNDTREDRHTNTSNNSNNNSNNHSTSNTILYYSRYTTARLRASTPNQRSPLYARKLRF